VSNEAGAKLAEAITTTAGRARFKVPSARLGPPGSGELRLFFDGTRDLAASSQVEPVLRQTEVRLRVPSAILGRLPAASPVDGLALDVAADASCLVQGCSADPSGTIEMRVGQQLVAAAPLRSGRARVTATFQAVSPGEVALDLRYRPDAPCFRAGNDQTLLLPVVGPKPWSRVATLLAGLAVLGWFLVPRLPSRRAALTAPLPPEATAGIVLRELEGSRADGADGWDGRVLDAHDRRPIGNAHIQIERPGFRGSEVVIETRSIVDGTFRIPAVPAGPSDQLLVADPLYTPLRRPLPTFGYLEITLVQRRRALLDRLVAWGKARGGAFDVKPEPTPAQIREAAGPKSPAAAWADAVEKAFYGGTVIDARVQSEIERLEPNTLEPTAEGGEKPAPRQAAEGDPIPSPGSRGSGDDRGPPA
jgi:hypothetical protein